MHYTARDIACTRGIASFPPYTGSEFLVIELSRTIAPGGVANLGRLASLF